MYPLSKLPIPLNRILACPLLVVIASSAHTQTQVFDNLHQMLPQSGEAWALAPADLDGDGDLDLVLGYDGQDGLFLNDGSGVFRDVSNTHMPADSSSTRALAVRDVDGDGDRDLAVGTDFTEQTRLYLNDGTGVFSDATATNMPVDADNTVSIVLCDIDGDTAPDILLGNWGQNRLYLNDGAGAFTDATVTHLPPDSDETSALALGDVDGDGDQDLVLGNSYGRQNRLYLNDGTGHFRDATATHLPPDSDDTTALALGDVDGDGDPDLVVGNGEHCNPYNCYDEQNRLYLNDGSGIFTDVTATHMPAEPFTTWAVAVADVDGDMDLDLVLRNLSGGGSQFDGLGDYTNQLYLNDGTGVFSDTTDTNLPPHSDYAYSLAVGDVDGDGDPDLVLGNIAENRLFLNDGAGVFCDAGATHLPLDSEMTQAIAFGDVDGDGDEDLVLGEEGSQNRLYLNDGSGAFSDATASHMPAYDDDTRAVALGDVDGDGDADLVTGNQLVTRLYLNDGTGLFSDVTGPNLPAEGPGKMDTHALVLGDVDGDGDLDIVLGRDSADRLYLNYGNGVFFEAKPWSWNNNTRALALGDVDDDGDPDLICGSGAGASGLASNWLFLNDGKGVFTAVYLFSSDQETRGLALGDVDGDSDLDLAVGNQKDQDRLYLNDGTGVFSDVTPTHMPVDSDYTTSLALGDMDEDGDLDLVLGRVDRLYLNDGKGIFSNATAGHWPTGYSNTRALALSDVDGDGDIDLALGGVYHHDHLFTNLTRQLAWSGIPRAGKPLTMDLYGPPNTRWILSVSTMPPLGGAAGLAAADVYYSRVVAAGFLDLDGRASFTMPDRPGLVGDSWFWWAHVNGVATNLEVTTFTDL